MLRVASAAMTGYRIIRDRLEFASRCRKRLIPRDFILAICYKLSMTTIQEIKTAIQQLSPQDQAELGHWMQHRCDDDWDRQMIRDAQEGKFDSIIAEVDNDIRAGRLRDFP